MRPGEAREQGTVSSAPTALGLLLLGCLLFLPSLGARELEHEEARRLIPAREMALSGDWILPTVWGRPYLNKPPLYAWTVAAAARVTGAFDELAVRLPAVLSTLLAALAVLLVAREMGGPRAGGVAGALLLVTWGVVEKSRLGELDPTLGLFAFLSTAALWFASRAARPGGWVLLSGAALAAALLTKGPPALVFFGAGAVAAAASGAGAGFLRSPRLWVALLLGVAPAALWAGLVLADSAALDARRTWSDQALRRSGWSGWSPLDAPAFLLGAAAYFLPALLVGLAGIEARRRAGERLAPAQRFALVAIVVGALPFVLAPATNLRYVYPLAPWCAVLGGLAADDAFSARGAPRAWLARACVALGALAGAAPLAACVFVALRSDPAAESGGVGAVGWTIGLVAAAATAFLALSPERRRRHALALVIVAFGAAALFRTAVVDPSEARERPHELAGARLAAHVPADATVYTDHWGDVGGYNELFYLDRRIEFRAEPDGLPPGSLFLFLVPAGAERAPDGEELAAIELRRGRRLVLVRLGRA